MTVLRYHRETVDPRERIMQTLAQLDDRSYYDLLGVRPGFSRHALRLAFHRFALSFHPDRHINESPEIREAAKKVFERGVEAYTVLRAAASIAVYNRYLSQGQLRLPIIEFERLAAQSRRPDTAVPPPVAPGAPGDTLADEMTTPEGVEVAKRVEQLVAAGRLREAYLQMGLLETLEPNNPAVERHGAELSLRLKSGSGAGSR